MTMNTIRLRTYWDADDAHLVISFLDELRDLLWESYGDEIKAMHQNLADAAQNDRQTDLFDDKIEF